VEGGGGRAGNVPHESYETLSDGYFGIVSELGRAGVLTGKPIGKMEEEEEVEGGRRRRRRER